MAVGQEIKLRYEDNFEYNKYYVLTLVVLDEPKFRKYDDSSIRYTVITPRSNYIIYTQSGLEFNELVSIINDTKFTRKLTYKNKYLYTAKHHGSTITILEEYL